MKPNLRVETKGEQENEVTDEPVSPTGQYFSSKALSVCILAVLESQVPIDDSFVMPQLRDVFLPINPRFSSIMVCDKKGFKRWKRVEVNLEGHINIPKFPAGLSVESYESYFDEYVTEIATKKIAQDRPLWEVHIVKYPTSKAQGHFIFKLHHALGDGYSLMGALLSCLKRADNPSIPLSFPSTRSSSLVKSNNDKISVIISWLPRTLCAIFNGLCDFGWSFLKSTFIPDEKSPIRSGDEGMSLHPPELSTLTLSLDQIHKIKAKLGTTINDLLTGILFIGVRLYMQETDIESSTLPSTLLVLLNTRNTNSYKSVEEMTNSHTKLWGNQFTFLQVSMPKLINTKTWNPLDIIHETKNELTRLKNSPGLVLTAQGIEIARKCQGHEAVAEMLYTTMYNSSGGITNMIGPIEQVALANHPIKGIYFMVCGIPSSLGMTIMSYMGKVTIAVAVQKGFIDSEKLNSCILKAFDLIYEAATNT